MLRAGALSRADLRSHDERKLEQTAGHVAELRGLVEERVEAHAEKVHEHELDDGLQAGRRSTDCSADEGCFGDRRIANALGSELLVQTAGDREDAAGLGDVDSDQADGRVDAHLGRDPFANRVHVPKRRSLSRRRHRSGSLRARGTETSGRILPRARRELPRRGRRRRARRRRRGSPLRSARAR